MSCFGERVSADLHQHCCNSGELCEFDGDMKKLFTAPIYVQQVFDAVRFNLQGMKTFNNQEFTPGVPKGHRIKRVIDIRCKRFFNPQNVEEHRNLTLDVDTSISGASFLKDSHGDYLKVVGADGTFSERILFADTSDCDDACKGTPIFGTQTVAISGNVIIEIDLLLSDHCGNDVVFTVCTTVNIAKKDQPMILTNFFEICMPDAVDTAFLPRFTEFCNSACETRLATNNFGRDLCISPEGIVSGNLIVAICLTCEKKIIVPVQLCVLSSGYACAPLQRNAICTTFPSLFPAGIREIDTKECLKEKHCEEKKHEHEHKHNEDDDDCKTYSRPQPKR